MVFISVHKEQQSILNLIDGTTVIIYLREIFGTFCSVILKRYESFGTVAFRGEM